MTPTKLLIGQIAIVFAVQVLGVWAATQWAAAMLGYQGELGTPWFWMRSWPLYRPWALFGWWYEFEAYAPHVFNRAGALAGASGFMGCATAIAGSLWRARQVGQVTTYGSARWASEREIARAGLFGDSGVFLGRLGHSYLRHDGPEHVMAFAPTRSGKGVGLVVPTLLSWTGSAVVHDIFLRTASIEDKKVATFDVRRDSPSEHWQSSNQIHRPDCQKSVTAGASQISDA